MKRLDILIFGGGLVGLACAIGLRKQGFSVGVIEKNAEAKNPRVSALTPNSFEFLSTTLGLDKAWMLGHCELFKKVKVWESHGGGHIQWDRPREYPASNDFFLGAIVENQILQEALLQEAERLGVVFYFGDPTHIQAAVGPDFEIFFSVTLNQKDKNNSTAKINANLLIGADGRHSFIRNYFGFKTKVKNYDQTAIVCTVQTEKNHQATAYQVFLPAGPLAFLPLRHPNHCSIVWSCKTEEAKILMGLSQTDFEKILTEQFNFHAENSLGKVSLLSARLSFELTSIQAERYVKNNILLIGDAAHGIHPLAGLGFNLGLEDVQALLAVFNDAKKRDRRIYSQQNLLNYEKKRRWENIKISQAMTAINFLFCVSAGEVKYFRTCLINQLNTRKSTWVERLKQSLLPS